MSSRNLLITIAVLLGSLMTLAWAAAPVTVALGIADIDHPAFRAKGIQLHLQDEGQQRSVRLEITHLALPQIDTVLRNVSVQCPASDVPLPQLRCPDAVMAVAETPWGKQQVGLDIDWRDSDHWSLAFRGLRHAAGKLKGRLHMNAGAWRLDLKSPRINPAKVQALRTRLHQLGIDRVRGRLSFDLEVRGRGGEAQYVALTVRGRGLSWSDTAGEQAGEKVAMRLRVNARKPGADWVGGARLSLTGGEVYSDPVFLDLGKQPMGLTVDGSWRPGRLSFKKLHLDMGNTFQLQGSGSMGLEPLAPKTLALRLDSDDLGQLFVTWVQPWLLDTAVGELSVKGKGAAHMRWSNGALIAADVTLADASVEQQQGRFGLSDLNGALHWVAKGEAPDSSLRFESAHVGALDFGAGRLRLNSAGHYAYLVQPLEIPFYEGRLIIPEATWLMTDTGGEGGFGLRLQGLSLQALTGDLGWPRMQGRVNASIPRARYRNGELQAAGDIVIDAFDGRLVLSDLRLSELGSAAPVLTANLRLRRLDLLQLTRTFSFGDIQGRLDGEIRNLRLVAWEPDRFDARLYTSPDDDRRHRISQRAVENLTELGNGVSGALSSGFLSLFKEFSYDRIELKIEQRGDRARIDGIPAPDGGYYLVKGAGIPRIDVIGRNREVAWQDLVARLRGIRVEGMQLQ